MVKMYSLETQFMLSRILQLGRMERPHLSQLFALGQEKVLSSPQTRGWVHVRKKSDLCPRVCWGHASCTGVSDLCPQDVAFPFCFSGLSRFYFVQPQQPWLREYMKAQCFATCTDWTGLQSRFSLGLRAVHPAASWAQDMVSYRSVNSTAILL